MLDTLSNHTIYKLFCKCVLFFNNTLTQGLALVLQKSHSVPQTSQTPDLRKASGT